MPMEHFHLTETTLSVNLTVDCVSHCIVKNLSPVSLVVKPDFCCLLLLQQSVLWLIENSKQNFIWSATQNKTYLVL